MAADAVTLARYGSGLDARRAADLLAEDDVPAWLVVVASLR